MKKIVFYAYYEKNWRENWSKMVLNKNVCGFWRERITEDGLLKCFTLHVMNLEHMKASLFNFFHYILIRCTCIYINMHLFTLQDINWSWWSRVDYLWIIVFLSAICNLIGHVLNGSLYMHLTPAWDRVILTAPIHCSVSIGDQVM